ncbi:hypothetical protein [Actinophytocola sp.]|uniref:hypothetical protein n=1 Tax=Actinophytocola sp. TaxID=1872138 RepID=UPI003D6C2799
MAGTVAGRSLRAGLVSTARIAVVAALGILAVWLLDGDSGHPVGVNLPDALWLIVIAAAWSLPAGVPGARAGGVFGGTTVAAGDGPRVR